MNCPTNHSQRCATCRFAMAWEGQKEVRRAVCAGELSPKKGQIVKPHDACRKWGKSW